eukprot:SAG25_NODE_545_length_7036_cov_4.224593_3_plen_239_part_00
MEAPIGTYQKFEDGFSQLLPPRAGTATICWMKQSTAMTFVCALLIASILYHFVVNVGLRWGAPCFIWWKHWATLATFVVGNAARCVLLPVAALTLQEIRSRSAADKYTKLLFQVLLFMCFGLLLDFLFCVFEVSEVCQSHSLSVFTECQQDWGDYGDGGILSYTPAAQRICPASCIKDGYDFSKRVCGSDPTHRTQWSAMKCETISVLYDVLAGGLFIAVSVSLLHHIDIIASSFACA